MYVPSGYVLFVRERALLAQSLDVTTGRLSGGQPIPVASGVDHTPGSARASFSVSANGEVLSHQDGSQQFRQLVAFDRLGKRLAAYGPEDLWVDVKLSHDGKRAALVRPDDSGKSRHLVDGSRERSAYQMVVAPSYRLAAGLVS